MRQIQTRIICSILAIILTFTGMCMDAKQADSFLEYSTLENQNKVALLSYDDTITYEAVCTQRMLGISELSFINYTSEHNNIRAKIRTSLITLIVSIGILRSTSLHMAEQIMCFSKPCLKAIILNYIHKQDGKK